MTRLFRSRLQSIFSELQETLYQVDLRSVDKLAGALLRARKIFVYGQGRTGHMSRAFAVRLMHLGMDVHFVGETTTPPITRRDLCLVNSGTGRTRFVYHVAAAAKKSGAKLATITAHPEARIAAMADIVVVVPAPTKGETHPEPRTRAAGKAISRQPPGSLFEQATLLLLDALVLVLMDRLHITARTLAKRHANIE